jgi:hypothetical protein
VDDELRRLGRLAGTWKVTGGVTGTTSYEWLDGGHFLLQRGVLDHDGHRVSMTEIIGRERRFGEEPGTEITARAYDADGNTLDYVYDLDGDTLTIWGGFKGSPGYFRGTFDATGDTLTGDWVWPGGGYHAEMERIA